MEEISRRGIYKNPEKKTRKKSKKKELSANSLRKLAGGWSRKEADELLESLGLFDQLGKIMQE